MEKYIAIPFRRYTNLIEKEKSRSGLRQEVEATMKNLENQDLLQRQRYYRETGEEMPKNHNKIIPQKAVFTTLPPPPIDKIREYKRKKLTLTDAELDAFFGTKTKKTRKPTVAKPIIKKEIKQKPMKSTTTLKTAQKFNLFDPAAFHRKSRK